MKLHWVSLGYFSHMLTIGVFKCRVYSPIGAKGEKRYYKASFAGLELNAEFDSEKEAKDTVLNAAKKYIEDAYKLFNGE